MCRFTSDKHEWFPAGVSSGVTITTYTMVAFSGRRAEDSERIMGEIMGREWGLIILDEVHVVPAQMFRKVGRRRAGGWMTGWAGGSPCPAPVPA